VECDAPWYPALRGPRPDTKVIQAASIRSSRATRSAASPVTWRWQARRGEACGPSPRPQRRSSTAA
jgi:hypothetical protein